MSNITTINPGRPPEPASREMADTLAALANKLEPGGAKFSISSQFAPDAETRQSLETRQRHMIASMAAAQKSDIERVVSKLMLTFPAMRRSDQDAAQTVAAYADVLRPYPLWAVRQCATDIARGHGGGNPSFAPSTAEMIVSGSTPRFSAASNFRTEALRPSCFG